MTPHLDPDDTLLRDRFDRAAGQLDVPPQDVAAVRSRGRQRSGRQRAAGVVAGLAVVTGLALGVTRIGPPVRTPAIDDPVSGPTASAPSEPTDEPTGAPDRTDRADRETVIGTVELGPTYPWAHTWFGRDGLRADHEDQPVPFGDLGVARAIASELGVVFQGTERADGVTQPTGGAILLRDRDGQVRELAPGASAQRLLTVAGGRAWFTFARPALEGSEEQLATVDLRTGAVEVLGTSNGVESFTDELAFLDPTDVDSRVAYLSCHLQCSLYLGSGVDVLVQGEPDPAAVDPLASGWLYGLAVSPDGSVLATVEGPDPNLEGDAVALVLLDLAGAEVSRIPLPEGIAYGSGRVEFTPDGRDVIATDREGGFLISDVLGDPHVDRLSVAQGLTFHGTRNERG